MDTLKQFLQENINKNFMPYIIKFSDEPNPKEFYRYGQIIDIFDTNNQSLIGRPYKNNLWLSQMVWKDSHFQTIQNIQIETNFNKNKSTVFPDFLTIRFGGICGNQRVIEFLEKNKIEYEKIPVIIQDYPELNYFLLNFRVIDAIDLASSNLVYNEDGNLVTVGRKHFYPFESNIFVKQSITEEVNSFYQIKGLNSMYICSEIIKEEFIEKNFTGFSSSEVSIPVKQKSIST